MGELGPAEDGFSIELHVRYGERDGRYLDWAITVVMRRGGFGEYMASGAAPLKRRRMRRFDVSETGIRQYTYDPVRPTAVEVLHPLHAGDEEIIDQGYDDVMTQLSQSWNARFPEPHPHTVATFAFASANRRPEFRSGKPYLTNTLVAIDPDIAEDVWIERGNAYFGKQGRSAAVLMPAREEWKYIYAEGPASQTTDQDGTSENIRVSAVQTTMGMLADLVNRGADWPDEPL